MKVHLLYKTRDFNWQQVRLAEEAREINQRGWGRMDSYFDPSAGLPWNEQALTADLSLDTLLTAMSQKDDCIYETSRRIILTSVSGDMDTILYRQDILQDCLDYPDVISELYTLAAKALEKKQSHYMSDYIRSHPDTMLRESIGIIEELLESLKKLNKLANEQAHKFTSEGWTTFFEMLKRDLDNEYLAGVEHHLKQLKLRHEALLLSAKLGEANKGSHYLLHEARKRDKSLRARVESVFTHKEPVYSFQLNPRDDAGSQALGELRDRGIGQVASAVGQSAENVGDFFDMLQVELAFYVGCLNLHKQLAHKGGPTCMPKPMDTKEPRLAAIGLYDVDLSLSIDKQVVGNDIEANGKDLIIITGTNTGGKSTFLRNIGIAQLMMQAGMFVSAKAFSSNLCEGLFTHYKREEDTEMDSGKFDEELSRMSDIVDHIKPHAMILFNESFAATNEREGSEIARQIITALLNKQIKTVCVTHLYELAHGFYKSRNTHSLFLQAERTAKGVRTFKMIKGEPLPTSYGEDLYKVIFNNVK